MPIRRVQHPDEPIQLHRLQVDKRTHPLLHAALLGRGMGSPRMNFIRDTLEAALAGLPPPPGESAGAPQAAASPPPTPAPAAPAAPSADLEVRRAKASALFQRGGFAS